MTVRRPWDDALLGDRREQEAILNELHFVIEAEERARSASRAEAVNQ